MLCNQIVGMEITPESIAQDPFIIKRIKGGRYAVFTHCGSLDVIAQTRQYIWGNMASIDERGNR